MKFLPSRRSLPCRRSARSRPGPRGRRAGRGRSARAAHRPRRDPFVISGSEAELRAEYAAVYGAIEDSILALVALPVETMDRETLRARLAGIKTPQD